MEERILAEERDYWTREVARRTADLEAARATGSPPHVEAAAALRLREAEERLTDMGHDESNGHPRQDPAA